jgi:hypothetical protein
VDLLQDARRQGCVVDDEDIEQANSFLTKAVADDAAHTEAGLYIDHDAEEPTGVEHVNIDPTDPSQLAVEPPQQAAQSSD